MTAQQPKVRCRKIEAADIGVVADLLARGFIGRSQAYWRRGLQRQATRDIPAGYPRFGYVLLSEDRPVGVLLVIYTDRGSGETPDIWCNLSSWYVEPEFRNYAPMLTRIAQRLPNVSYVNISAAPRTWPIIEAQGFKPYCRGLFFALPALSPGKAATRIEHVSADTTAIAGLSPDETALLARHAGYGCLSLVVRSGETASPFVLQQARMRRGAIALPAMQLIYCRNIGEFAACAGALGRLLLRRGMISVILDANGPVPGLAGVYTERRGRKYLKGPGLRRLGDLADTELVLYGA